MPGAPSPLVADLLFVAALVVALLVAAVLLLLLRARVGPSADVPPRPVTGGELARRMLQQQHHR